MINTEASGFGCKQSHKRAFNRRHAGSRDSGLLLNIWLTSANSSKEKLKTWLRFDIKERIHPSMNVIASINRWRKKSIAVLWLFFTNVDWCSGWEVRYIAMNLLTHCMLVTQDHHQDLIKTIFSSSHRGPVASHPAEWARLTVAPVVFYQMIIWSRSRIIGWSFDQRSE